MKEIRNNWSKDEISEIYNLPLFELMNKAQKVHEKYQVFGEVQVCTLLSIKTGGCPEDCAYCPQAARYQTDVKVHKLLDKKEVIEKAQAAIDAGSTRFCMGAAWREVRDNSDFDKVVDMVQEVNNMGLEVCATLGMLNENQALRLKEAGLHAYNHNLDTSDNYYEEIISTRTYDDRLNTLNAVRKAGLTVCSGGIVGLGETDEDRVGMLHVLSNLEPHPESVPINKLVAVSGTPLEEMQEVDTWAMIRMIATARIVMPESMVRLSAGRESMSEETQALCFMVGANSIFSGEVLLTCPNPDFNKDMKMFENLGLKKRKSFKHGRELDQHGLPTVNKKVISEM